MKIISTAQFNASSKEYLSAREILSLESRLRQDPYIGTPVEGTSRTFRRLAHPQSGRLSDLGHRPVVAYLIVEPSNQLILVDVAEDPGAFKKMLKDPFTLLRIYSVLRAIKDALGMFL